MSFRVRRTDGWLPVVLICFAVALAFRAAPFLDFVDYDDPAIVESAALRGGLSVDSLRFALTATPLNLWHPLTFLSHALDFQIYGDWAGGHHLTNVLVHLASCLLLFAWLRRHSGEAGLSLAVALLFAVHPLRVESVVWVAERKDVLSVFFYLLTLWFYSAWATAQGPARRRLYLLSLATAALGVLSKPSLMTLPAALLLADLWPLRRLEWADRNDWAKIRSRLVEKVPFLLLAVAAATVAWVTWSGSQFIGEAPDFGLSRQIGFAALAYLSYLSRTFVPVDLVPFLPYPLGASAWWLAGAAVGLAALSVWILTRSARAPWLVFGWFWFLGLILPGSGVVTISDHFAPDRYTYLAHLGLFVALVWGAASLGRRFGFPAAAGWGALVLVLVPLVWMTDRQSRVWRNSETLWRHTLSATERNYVAHNQLALVLLESDRYDEGVAELEAAIAANPGFPIPLGNLAVARAKRGDFAEAARLLREAGPQLPGRARVRAEFIAASLLAGDREGAAAFWRDFAAEDPGDAAIQLGAAEFFYRIGEEEEAIRLYHAAARLDPNQSRATLGLGAMLLKRGALDQAVPWLERSVDTAPDAASAAEASRTLAQGHLLRGAWGEAIASYERALGAGPPRALVANEAAQLLLDCPDPSYRDPKRALELAETLRMPEGTPPAEVNPRYQRTLARALALNGKREAARETAGLGLEAVESLLAQEPLPDPWSAGELEELRDWFAALIASSEEA